MPQIHIQTPNNAAVTNLNQFLKQPLSLQLDTPAANTQNQNKNVRLIRLDEINEEGHQTYKQALANVYATLDANQAVRLLYLLDGGPTGVNLYFGVTADEDSHLHEAMKNLRGALEGQLPGINFGAEISSVERQALLQRLSQSNRMGVVLGTPTTQGQEQQGNTAEQNFQDIDRLVRSMHSGNSKTDTWQLAIISQPLSKHEIYQQLDAAYELSSLLSQQANTNLQFGDNTSLQTGTSTGSSESIGSNSGTSKTTGENKSFTKGDNTSDTRGKSEGASKNTTSGKSYNYSSSSDSSSSADGQNWGTSESHTTGKSNSKTSGTSDSDTRSEGLSLNHTTNAGTNQSNTTGRSVNISKEITDKRAQHLAEYLDKQLILRLQKGLTKGLFHSAIYLAADNASLYQRLKHTVRATFQGNDTTLAPLQVYDLPDTRDSNACRLLQLPQLQEISSRDELLFYSLYADQLHHVGSLVTADELAIVASLPQYELQGVRRRRSVEFIVDLPEVNSDQLDLGSVIDRGRRYPNNKVMLAKKDLNKHIFVTGVTGAGKTNTCLNLLLESGLPFLVIEPAKTEYRELARHLEQVDYFRPNGDAQQSLRINPFALVRRGQQIKSHAGFLKNVFAAIFPMEASMPAMVEAAILAAYEDKGWDLDDNIFLANDDPFEPESRAWPTMTDMIAQLDRLIPSYKMGKELEEKYRGSLVSRLRSLTDGTLGQVLDVPQSFSFDDLLDRHAVIELEELQSGEEKALLMALILGGINEAIRTRFARESTFRHLTLIEEAHRLLSKPEGGDKTGALAVGAFADMLAEVRKYGEGLIIADQIPAKLIPDVIKNTHTKIVHRLFAEDDRRTMGEAMMMNEDQRNFLPNLQVGEAVVFCGGWHGPAHAAIRNDLAQSDNNDQPQFDINEYGIKQLWRERTRYYPQFSKLGLLNSKESDAETYTSFARETRQAQRQLLRLGNSATNTKQAETAFNQIKNWHKKWENKLKHEQLVNAWIALLQDANLRTHPDKNNQQALEVGSSTRAAIELLIKIIQQTNNLQEWNIATKSSGEFDPEQHRSLKNHLEELSNYKSL